MIAKIITSRDKAGKEHYGAGMRGLIAYLVGPGKANEHTDPHLVASSGTLAVEYAGTGWDADKAGSLARVVDGAWRQARRTAGLPLTTTQDGQNPAARGAAQGEHVFHAVLSLRADEGQLSDEQWGRIAADYMDAMGFTAASGRAESQWVAVRHGLSAEGNDHLHLTACMVREDGTRWSDWQSKKRSREAADAIEARYGLRPVKDHSADRGTPGYTAAELGRAERERAGEVDRLQVTRRVRAAAALSTSEAQFVRTARTLDLLVRPRYAKDGTGAVVGYSAAVAPRPGTGERPVWFGGGRLDWRLSLPRMRARWQEDEQGLTRAVMEWRSAGAWRDPARPGRRAGGGWQGLPRINVPLEAARDIARANRELAGVDLHDRAAWVAAAGEAAGVLAAWSVAVEGAQPGPLARAADRMARAAMPRRDEQVPSPRYSMAGRHLRLLVRAGSRDSAQGWEAVLQQVAATVHAVQQGQMVRGELVHAGLVRDGVQQELAQVRAAFAAVPALEPAGAESAGPATAAGTPGVVPGVVPGAPPAQYGPSRHERLQRPAVHRGTGISGPGGGRGEGLDHGR